MKTLVIILISFSLLPLTTGCTTVKVWERGTLAKDEMAWQPDPMESTLQRHIYFSKEGSSGGGQASGGGCGCN